VLVARRPRANGDSNFPADKRDFLATAAVYSPTCVLTATHVVQGAGVDVSATVKFFAGADAEHDADKRWKPKAGASVFAIKSIVKIFGVADPTKPPENGQPEIALVEVDKFPDDAKYQAFALADANPAVGDKISATGYGLKNPWAAPADRESSRAQIELVTNVIYDKGTAFRAGDPAKPPTTGVAPGDSGGPSTVGGKLVGILSRGYPFNPAQQPANAGNGIYASVPYAFSHLSDADKDAIAKKCGPALVIAPIDEGTSIACDATAPITPECDPGAGWDDPLLPVPNPIPVPTY
jgi:trypsin